MEPGNKFLQQVRVRAWQMAGPALDAMRHEEIRNRDAGGIGAAILTTEMFQRLGVAPTVETGLVEQQAWFAKLRHG